MTDQQMTRRGFLNRSLLTGGAAALSPVLAAGPAQAGAGDIHVACNSYSWTVFYQREGRDFRDDRVGTKGSGLR